MSDPEIVVEGLKPGDYIMVIDRACVPATVVQNLPFAHWRERGIFIQVLHVYDAARAVRLLRVEPAEKIEAP